MKIFLILLSSLLANSLLADELVEISNGKNYINDYVASPGKGLVNVVIEIPAGSHQKWEVKKSGDGLEWEMKKGKRRIVRFLPYVFNYGMVPQTLLSKKDGGDGDPLDALLLGERRKRGEVVTARVLGVLRLKDGGETDDKIVTVDEKSPLAAAGNLQDMRQMFPGALEIVETWLRSYKGPGEMVQSGSEGPREALEMIEKAHQSWATQKK